MYIKQGNTMILVGRVLREAKLRTTKSGKQVSSFFMQYGYHHDENGKPIRDCIDVSMWGNNAAYIGDEDIGVAKGDTVLVIGFLTKDDYHTEEGQEQRYKITADIVLDMTSIFQVAQMVVNPTSMEKTVTEEPYKPSLNSGFTDVDDGEGDPFVDEDDSLRELPY